MQVDAGIEQVQSNRVQFVTTGAAQAVAGDFGADDPGTQGQNIGIVVAPGKHRGGRIVTQGRTHTRMAVGGDADTDAGAADNNTTLGPPIRNSRRQLGGLLGVVDGLRTVNTKIEHGQAALFNNRLQLVLELEAGMIWVNSQNVRHLPTPFGGTKSSGIGRDGGDWSFDFYMETKNIAIAFDTHAVPKLGG